MNHSAEYARLTGREQGVPGFISGDLWVLNPGSNLSFMNRNWPYSHSKANHTYSRGAYRTMTDDPRGYDRSGDLAHLVTLEGTGTIVGKLKDTETTATMRQSYVGH